MECHRPIKIPRSGTEFGDENFILVACGHCPACDLNRISTWKARTRAELKYSSNAWFITLTYSDEYLPFDPETGVQTLKKSDYQAFFKRLRANYAYQVKKGNCLTDLMPQSKQMRFVLCGEYGGKYERPHYHVLLFNVPPHVKRDQKLFLLEQIELAWNKGLIHIGEVTPASIDYVVSYIAGKRFANDMTGRIPPFMEMSRRPGIGFAYVERNKNYHQSDVKNRYTMSAAYNRASLGRYYKQKIFTPEQLKQINNDIVETFFDRRLEQDAAYLKEGVDPEMMRKVKQQQEFKRMKYKLQKKKK